jgi:hypothetical protein
VVRDGRALVMQSSQPLVMSQLVKDQDVPLSEAGVRVVRVDLKSAPSDSARR